MSRSLSRRSFLASCAAAASLPIVPPPLLAGARRALVLRVGLVREEGDVAAMLRRGVELGVEEADATARLLGARVELAGPDDPATLLAAGATALVGGATEAVCRDASAAADARDGLFVNAACRADALRRACAPRTVHVAPSEAMLAAAVAAHGDATLRAVAWHPSLERFGAAQLNDRFRAHHGAGMNAEAWGGWMAVKVLVESALRVERADAAALERRLLDARAAFDGHKGRPLGFRAADRQLWQPLYLVRGDAVAAEVPEGRDAAARGFMEKLGAPGSGERACAAR